MNMSALARVLNISRQMLYKHKAQGMPINSIEAAVAWRQKNIHPFRSKHGRIDHNPGIKSDH